VEILNSFGKFNHLFGFLLVWLLPQNIPSYSLLALFEEDITMIPSDTAVSLK